MSIKLFGEGLGFIDHPFLVQTKTSISPVEDVATAGGDSMDVIVDQSARPVLGNSNFPALLAGILGGISIRIGTQLDDSRPDYRPPSAAPLPPLPTALTSIGRADLPQPPQNV